MTNLIEDTRVKLVTAVLCAVSIIVYVRYDTHWRANTTNSIQALARSIEEVDGKIVGKTPDSWHRRDMLKFAVEAERINDGWTAPKVPWER